MHTYIYEITNGVRVRFRGRILSGPERKNYEIQDGSASGDLPRVMATVYETDGFVDECANYLPPDDPDSWVRRKVKELEVYEYRFDKQPASGESMYQVYMKTRR